MENQSAMATRWEVGYECMNTEFSFSGFTDHHRLCQDYIQNIEHLIPSTGSSRHGHGSKPEASGNCTRARKPRQVQMTPAQMVYRCTYLKGSRQACPHVVTSRTVLAVSCTYVASTRSSTVSRLWHHDSQAASVARPSPVGRRFFDALQGTNIKGDLKRSTEDFPIGKYEGPNVRK